MTKEMTKAKAVQFKYTLCIWNEMNNNAFMNFAQFSVSSDFFYLAFSLYKR